MTEQTKNFMKGKHWIIAIIVIVAGYQVFTGLRDLTNKGSADWTEEDRTIMIEKCISDTGDKGILFPDLTREYCNCSHDLLFAQFTKSDYVKILKKPFEEQVKETKHIFQDCLTTYEDKMKAQTSEDWTEGEYKLMVEKCIQNSGENAVNHPVITREYCECSRIKMIESISKAEMTELIKKPVAEQNEQLNPLVADCLTEFEKALELANNKKGHNKRYSESPNCLSDTSVQLDRDPAHSARICASSYFLLSGLRLSQRSALWILLWGLGSFTTLVLFTKGMATRHILALPPISSK